MTQWVSRGVRLSLAFLGGVVLLLLALTGAVFADPIAPPEGYPKLILSAKMVTPTLAHTGGTNLTYFIEIRNTGAYTAAGTHLVDTLPQGTTYNGDAWASFGPMPTVTNDTLSWMGDVGFDATVVVSFSVSVAPDFTGTVRNIAVISHPMASEVLTVAADTVVTDRPILTIEKQAQPAKPGANKPLVYTLLVRNQGQPTGAAFPITVTDEIPQDTTLRDVGPDGMGSGLGVTWTRSVSLDLGQSTAFTFSVDIGDVSSGTVIANNAYQVSSAETGVTMGDPYTVTIVDPILQLSKSVWPDPPGSNREMTYTLTLWNFGSLATDLIITDRIPSGVAYQRADGTMANGVIRWHWPSLDTGEKVQFTYTVYISDVMGVDIVNAGYGVCSGEGVCAPGVVLTSVVHGPTFEAEVMLDPIAKKPGGGGGPVTPTIIIRNVGPGNAIDAMAVFEFGRISVNANDFYADPAVGTPSPFPSYKCGDKCVAFEWVGSLNVGDMVTFTTMEGQSTIGGEEGTHYTATVTVTDALSSKITPPVTATAIGKVTHMAYLLPRKSAPAVIGRGQVMTYSIHVENTALATDEPPYPYLIDSLPVSTTVISISHGGVLREITSSIQMNIISWTLPGFGTGEDIEENRWFSVRVDDDLISGTQIINSLYRTYWYELEDTKFFSVTGEPVTTTVVEVGLVDSYKEVMPKVAWPGPGNIFTYYVHINNTSPLPLTGVEVYDDLPWEHTTYQRDAVASAGQVMSDIVSIRWIGSVEAYSEEIITFTVLADEDYEGPLVNTAVISHPDLLQEVVVEAIAYITDEPVLQISKSASPDPVAPEGELVYTIKVRNLGQQATALVVTDTIPANVTYVAGSATGGGTVQDAQLRWTFPGLDPGESLPALSFRVLADGGGSQIVNDDYAVRCAEGVSAFGYPVVTRIRMAGGHWSYLPIMLKGP